MTDNAPERPRKKKRKRNPPHKYDEVIGDTAQGLAMVGASHEVICQVLQDVAGVALTPTALRRHYRVQLDWGKLRANAAVAAALYNAAIQVATDHRFIQAAIFYAKTQLGWRERERLDDVLEEAMSSLEASNLPKEEKVILARDMQEWLTSLETGGRK